MLMLVPKIRSSPVVTDTLCARDRRVTIPDPHKLLLYDVTVQQLHRGEQEVHTLSYLGLSVYCVYNNVPTNLVLLCLYQ